MDQSGSSSSFRNQGLILGAHLSIAGGYHRAVERAAKIGCDCLQLFTQNNLRWENRRISRSEAQAFQTALAQYSIVHPLVHANYLINLASPSGKLWRRSVRAFAAELRRASALGIPWVVVHPGSATDGNLEAGLSRVIKAVDEAFAALPKEATAGCLLEVTAGQGKAIGARPEDLAAILAESCWTTRLGVCLDTCHLFAAGYPLAPRDAYERTMDTIDATVGISRVKAIHLNDSRAPLGSHIDRHAHIGRGQIGLEGFRLIVNDPRFRGIPMYIETPKEVVNGQDMDVVNLALLRSLFNTAEGSPGSPQSYPPKARKLGD